MSASGHVIACSSRIGAARTLTCRYYVGGHVTGGRGRGYPPQGTKDCAVTDGDDDTIHVTNTIQRERERECDRMTQ